MKKIKITISALVMALILATQVNAQEIDQERMERDLKIAENILATLASNDRNIFSHSRNIESNYIPDYGVIFSLPRNTLVYARRSKGGVAIVAPVAPSSGSGSSYSYVVADDDEIDEDDAEEINEKINTAVEEQMTIFLVDYADLIGQLKPSDRIMLNVKSVKNEVWVSSNSLRTNKDKGKTAEILKSDLIAYKQGKASREETISKIKFTEKGDETKDRDLELFSSIFSRLYEPDLSTTYYASSRNINYERLENLGAIFSMRVYSSTENNGRHTIRTTGESGLTREQRDSKVNAMYPEFEQSFKENLIDYGRTVKSLKPNEMLVFKVRLTECKTCEMPRSIEVSVKASILNDFDSGKINRDAAVKAVSIKKTSN